MNGLRPLYVLHPGEITCSQDGQRHYVGSMSLQRLYGVPLEDCMLADPQQPTYRTPRPIVHLRPDPTGAYKLPEAA